MSDYGIITGDSTAVRLERVFLIPVEQLWAYLTTPEGLRRWIAEGQIGPGHARLEFLDNGTVIEGPVLAWDPPSLVEFEWADCARTTCRRRNSPAPAHCSSERRLPGNTVLAGGRSRGA